MAEVGPDPYVPWELLMLDADFGAVRPVELAAEDSCAAEQGVVAFDFPALDCGDVECETPD